MYRSISLLLAAGLLLGTPGVRGQVPGSTGADIAASKMQRFSVGFGHPLGGPYEYWSTGPSVVVAIMASRAAPGNFRGVELQHTRFAFDRSAYLDENAWWLEASPDTTDVAGGARSLTSIHVSWTRQSTSAEPVTLLSTWGAGLQFLGGPKISVEGQTRTEYSRVWSFGVMLGGGVGYEVSTGRSLLAEAALYQGVWPWKTTSVAVRLGLLLRS